MSVSALFKISQDGGSTYAPAGESLEVDRGATVTCTLDSTDGVSSVSWSIIGTDGSTTPAPTLINIGSPAFSCSFDAKDGYGVAYGIKCVVNGGTDSAGTIQATYTAISAVYTATSNGLHTAFTGEVNEDTDYSGSVYGWTEKVNAAIKAVDTAAGLTVDLEDVLGNGNDAATNTIENLSDPVNPQDAATRNYVDGYSPITIDFTPQATSPSHLEGRVHYNSTTNALEVYSDIADASLSVGQEQWIRVTNNTGTTISDGSVVRLVGSSSSLPDVELAQADSVSNVEGFLGVATHDIANGSQGFVTRTGIVRNLDTSSFSEGDNLYVSPSVAGGITNTLPTGTNPVVHIGICVVSNATQGSILVLITSPTKLGDLYDVLDTANATTDGYIIETDSNGDWYARYRSDFSLPTSGFDRTLYDPATVCTLSYDNGTRTFTIAPVSTSYEYFCCGFKYTKTSSDSVVWTDTEGLHYIYFDGDTLTSTQNSTTIRNVIQDQGCLVGLLYWDADNQKVSLFGEERHGRSMSGAMHLYLHEYNGAVYGNGLAPTNINSDAGGATDADSQFGFTAGSIVDEDIFFLIDGYAVPANIPIYYKEGSAGNWRKSDSDDFPFIQPGAVLADGTSYAGTTIPYNEYTGATWQLTAAGNNNFINMHYFATTSMEEPVIGIVGEEVYNTIGDARLGITTEIEAIVGTVNLLSAEAKALWSIIYQTSSGFANTSKATIRSDGLGNDYVDFRLTNISGTGGTAGSTPALIDVLAEGNYTGGNNIVVTSGDAITMGTTPAAAGDIRLSNTQKITGRNAANTGDMTMLEVTSLDRIVIGSTGADQVDLNPNTQVNINAQLDLNGYDITAVSDITFQTSTVSATLTQGQTTGSASDLRIEAQNTTSPTDSGGDLLLYGGDATSSSGNGGRVILKGGDSGTGSEGEILSNSPLNMNGNPITVATYYGAGSDRATSGRVRLENNDSIQFRNNAGTLNILGLQTDSSDNIVMGTNANLIEFDTDLSFSSTLSTPQITQGSTTGAATSITIAAQNTTSSTDSGGDLLLYGGDASSSSGGGGNVILQGGDSGSGNPGFVIINYDGVEKFKLYQSYIELNDLELRQVSDIRLSETTGTAIDKPDTSGVTTSININGQDTYSSSADGGLLYLRGGHVHSAVGTGTGGDVTITGGSSNNATATGGDVTITGGNSYNGTGGNVILQGGGSTAGTEGMIQANTDLDMNSNDIININDIKFPSTQDGQIIINSINSSSTGNAIIIDGQINTGTGDGGGCLIRGGAVSGVNNGGYVELRGGSTAAGIGGSVILRGGPSSTGTDGVVKIQSDTTVRIEANSNGLGFFASTPVAKPTVTGSTDTDKIDNLLTALANLGLITDSTT